MRKKQLLAAIDGLNDTIALKETALQEVNEHYGRRIADLNDQIQTLIAIIAHQGGAAADDAMAFLQKGTS